ncbi:MAG: hypothetical protein AAGD34_05590 [Pseudomonadota bacterium]
MRLKLIASLAAVTFLTGCLQQHQGETSTWFASNGGVPPRTDRVTVCHGFGCHLKTSYAFSSADVQKMKRFFAGAKTAKAERAAIANMIGWVEKRVAPKVGSENDEGGLDIANAGKRGQMDCIDEAANTTSYLMVAERHGLLRFHKVARPVARGFFLDGRYPHATAVVVAKGGEPWSVDSWPSPNGVKPTIMPLAKWYAESTAVPAG